MRAMMMTAAALSVMLGGCGQKAPAFPADALDQAATCGVVTAATEREAAGARGELPAEAQARILHYAMLYGSTGKALDQDKVNQVSKRMPALFEKTIKGDWQSLRSNCASAFPASRIRQPTLPPTPLDAMLECDALAGFLRNALADEGSTYGAAANAYGVFLDKLDPKISVALRAAGLRAPDIVRQKKVEALAAATRLGQPPAVIDACRKAYAS